MKRISATLRRRLEQLIVWLQPVLRHTIWGRGVIPPADYKIRNLKRVALPILDILFFLGGLSAAHYGVPAISEFFPGEIVDLFSLALSGAAVLAFAGVAIPRLWAIEVFAKSIILALMSGYVVALLILTRAGEGNRGFVLIVAAAACVLPVWRLSGLGDELQERNMIRRRLQKIATAEIEVQK